MNGKQKVGLSAVVSFVVTLVCALTFYFTTSAAITADVRENSVRIEAQEKQTERVLDKLERIEGLLLREKK